MTSLVTDSILDKRCFFISRIGSENSQERANSDFVLANILRPELEPQGYEVIRADQDPSPHMTRSILTHLLMAELVVADISGGNPNVAYETAVRHASGKPCVILLQKAERPPFDLSVIKYIPYDQSLAAVSHAREQLKMRLAFISSTPDYYDSDLATLTGVRFLKLEQ